jgi:hypothetical protein
LSYKTRFSLSSKRFGALTNIVAFNHPALSPILWILVGILFIIMLLVLALPKGRPLGKRLRFGRGSVYFTSEVPADEALKVGRYLEWKGLFKAWLIDARLIREGATRQLQLIIGIQKPDEEQELAAEVLAAGLSDDLFAGAPVEVHLCDRIFRPMSVISHHERFGRRIAMNAASLFYMEGVEESHAFQVATFLAEAGLFNNSSRVAQIDRAGAGYEFRLAVDVEPLTEERIEGARRMSCDLSEHVLAGMPVEVRYCHGLMETLRTVGAKGTS